MTDKPLPPRWAFEIVEELYAKWRNCEANPLNVDVVMRNPSGWVLHHCFAAYIERREKNDAENWRFRNYFTH